MFNALLILGPKADYAFYGFVVYFFIVVRVLVSARSPRFSLIFLSSSLFFCILTAANFNSLKVLIVFQLLLATILVGNKNLFSSCRRLLVSCIVASILFTVGLRLGFIPYEVQSVFADPVHFTKYGSAGLRIMGFQPNVGLNGTFFVIFALILVCRFPLKLPVVCGVGACFVAAFMAGSKTSAFVSLMIFIFAFSQFCGVKAMVFIFVLCVFLLENAYGFLRNILSGHLFRFIEILSDPLLITNQLQTRFAAWIEVLQYFQDGSWSTFLFGISQSQYSTISVLDNDLIFAIASFGVFGVVIYFSLLIFMSRHMCIDNKRRWLVSVSLFLNGMFLTTLFNIPVFLFLIYLSAGLKMPVKSV